MASSDLRKALQQRFEDDGLLNRQTMIVVLASALWLLAFMLLVLIQPGLLLVTGVVLFCAWQHADSSRTLK